MEESPGQGNIDPESSRYGYNGGYFYFRLGYEFQNYAKSNLNQRAADAVGRLIACGLHRNPVAAMGQGAVRAGAGRGQTDHPGRGHRRLHRLPLDG